MRKVFISFLGTNEYVPVNYMFKDKTFQAAEYVQEIFPQYFRDEFGEHDVFYYFLTPKAKEKNWDDANGHKGLHTRLKEMNISASVQPVQIEEPKSEEQLWNTFHQLYGYLEENDLVYFDITHSFRYFPMLMMVLLNYSVYLKNIRVGGIYYGAFEVLGRKDQVLKMPMDQRNAPVLDFTRFHDIQNWTRGADHFLNYGDAEYIADIINQATAPILKQTRGRDEFAKQLKALANQLTEISLIFKTNRGKEIIDGSQFLNTRQQIETIKKHNTHFQALDPILDKIEDGLKIYNENEIKNGFTAARWCAEHNLIQQSITILKETIISYLCHYFGMDKYNLESRNMVSGLLSVVASKKPKEEWDQNIIYDMELAEKIVNDEIFSSLVPINDKISKKRNNLNHAGMSRDELGKPNKLKSTILRDIEELERIMS